PDDPLKTTDQTRSLGLIVCRGTAVMLVSPTDGTDEIANPFLEADGA
ncbi:U6 snRNA-associated Sm-like protein LSm7, partial [Trifolium medium]|nr:U6 snRNA-associated Sm-like protein LSm7 [Trifolium medium]